MARYTGPRDKLSRREGFDLFGAGEKLSRRAGAGAKRRQKYTIFGAQLREKQKIKSFYGIMEKQFKRYITEAQRRKGAPDENLITILESRLDNILFRSRAVPTRTSARQLIRHGHIKIGNQKVTYPSYLTKPGERVFISPRASEIPAVLNVISNRNVIIPEWLERKGLEIRMRRPPQIKDIKEDLSLSSVVEFYSK